MVISINGQKETWDDGLTIGAILEAKKIRPEMVSVELNESIIERNRYAEIRLKEGDTLEFLYFMGGGGQA